MITLKELLEVSHNGTHRTFHELKPLSSIVGPYVSRASYITLLEFEEKIFFEGNDRRYEKYERKMVLFLLSQGLIWSENDEVHYHNSGGFNGRVRLEDVISGNGNNHTLNTLRTHINSKNLPVWTEKSFPSIDVLDKLRINTCNELIKSMSYTAVEVYTIIERLRVMHDIPFIRNHSIWNRDTVHAHIRKWASSRLCSAERKELREVADKIMEDVRVIPKFDNTSVTKHHGFSLAAVKSMVNQHRVKDIPILTSFPNQILNVKNDVIVDVTPEMLYNEVKHQDWVRYQMNEQAATFNFCNHEEVNIEELEAKIALDLRNVAHRKLLSEIKK